MKHKKNSLIAVGIILLLATFFIFKDQASLVLANDEEENGEENATHDLTDEQIIYLTDHFIDILVQDTDKANRVTTIDTKEQLFDKFDQVSTRDAAEEYVDFYYSEKIDGLYLTPTELPPWFIKENNYDRIQVDKNKVKIIQHNDFDLYGDYTIEIEFTLDTDWKISRITHK